MTKNYAAHKMREKGETEYRHEQFVLQDFMRKESPGIRLEMEYGVYSTDGALVAKIDLADLDHKVAYRLDGGSHNHPNKDKRQKEALERRGWKVIDCKKDSWHWAWLWD